MDTDDKQLQQWLEFDCGCLRSEAIDNPDVSVKAVLAEPQWGLIPPVSASMHSPEYVCYDSGSVRYVDYFGKALAIHHRTSEHVEIVGTNRDFVYEKLYLIVLSRVGELLDRRGIHRVHALGLSTPEGAALVLLPMHGGKSTLGLALMSEPGFKLLSDDTPLISRAGTVLPFPVRLGVRTGDEPDSVPKQFLRSFSRENREPKTLISLDAFGDKVHVNSAVPPRILIVGQWTAAENPSVSAIGVFSAFRALLRDCVFGLGLPQIVEFFLQSTTRDTLSKMMLAWSRIYASLVISVRSKCYRVYLSRDLERNRELILKLLLEGRA
ncbi:MAG: hypothetical protein KDD66_05960 [Bdellovibrionales bacterium]|nr:hypothetical protein [Bdellovibrionales bacterium]